MRTNVFLTVLAILLCGMTAHAQNGKGTFQALPLDLVGKLMDTGKGNDLFQKDLSNAIYEEGGWAVENDVLTAKGKGDIWTKERYGNFMLSLEFRCEKDTNSGVFIRCGDIKNWLHTAIEVQILQNNQDYENKKHHCGGIFDCVEPATQMVKGPGEWNQYVIIAKDNFIHVLLNGTQVVGMDLNLWTQAHINPDNTPNKFNAAYKDMPREGHIGLQYHGHPVAFRNLRIQTLN
jgi:hypothetical protein